MASLIWDDEAIVRAMVKYHKTNGKWPKSRDWWYANKGRWPSFTTVCNRPLGWKGLLQMAQRADMGLSLASLYATGELKFGQD
jgi:hypothetical protein